MAEREDARRLHMDLEFIGLRAQATSVGLVQLCAELVNLGILSGSAINRIKDAVREDIMISNKVRNPVEFEEMLRQRLDAIFPRADDARRIAPVGAVQNLENALTAHP